MKKTGRVIVSRNGFLSDGWHYTKDGYAIEVVGGRCISFGCTKEHDAHDKKRSVR